MQNQDFLGAPQLQADQMHPAIYELFIGPHVLDKALALLKYELRLQNKSHTFGSWEEMAGELPDKNLEKEIFYRVR